MSALDELKAARDQASKSLANVQRDIFNQSARAGLTVLNSDGAGPLADEVLRLRAENDALRRRAGRLRRIRPQGQKEE